MQEVIIAQGYEAKDSTVPENIKHLAEIKSGYLQQLASYNLAKYEYENSKLSAPFSGIVANIEDNESNPTSSKPFCRIIADKTMKISFNIIESELEFLSMGSRAEVFVFSKPGKSWKECANFDSETVKSQQLSSRNTNLRNTKHAFHTSR